MNFGQALMYGAFGSLTGGMGCFGGGMGMMNPMGMGGSLFSMMGCGLGNMYGTPASFFGMGGYGCGISDSQYVGTLASMMGSGLLIGGITQAIRNHKAAKAEAQSKINNAKDDVSTLTSEINALEKENTELANPISVDGKVSAAATKACPTEAKAYTAAKTALDNFDKKDLSTFTNATITSLENELAELKKDPTANTEKIKQKETEIENARIAEKEEQKKAYKTKVDTAMADLDTAIQGKIQENKDEIAAKKAKRDEAQKILDDIAVAERAKLNNKNAKLEAECDGNGADRVDENTAFNQQMSYKAKFNYAYEQFKKDHSKTSFSELKNAYNNLVTNTPQAEQSSLKSYTKLMEHILKQHKDEFEESNIQWAK